MLAVVAGAGPTQLWLQTADGRRREHLRLNCPEQRAQLDYAAPLDQGSLRRRRILVWLYRGRGIPRCWFGDSGGLGARAEADFLRVVHHFARFLTALVFGHDAAVVRLRNFLFLCVDLEPGRRTLLRTTFGTDRVPRYAGLDFDHGGEVPAH